MPSEIENLLEISRIKQKAKKQYITKIQSKPGAVVFTYDVDKFDTQIVNKAIEKYSNRIKFSSGIKPMITLNVQKNGEKELVSEIKSFLDL